MNGDVPTTLPTTAPTTGLAERWKLSEALKASDIKILVIIGKCMDHFGMNAVLGFLIGATAVYGYALFQQLPYYGIFNPKPVALQSSTQPAAEKTPEKRTIRGVVVDGKNNVVTDAFQVGVVEIVSGEFTNGDGQYQLEVPRHANYKLAFWKPNYENLRVLEVFPDEDGKIPQSRWLQRTVALKESSSDATGDSRIADRQIKWRSQDPMLKVEDLDRTLAILPKRYDALSAEE